MIDSLPKKLLKYVRDVLMKELIGQRETGDDPPRGKMNSSQIPTRTIRHLAS